MSLLSWSVILLINEAAPIQWRKKMRLMSNQVDISSVIFHSSHSKGTQKQLLSRIILAQHPCHIAIKAFCSILTIAVCRCTIITLLLDFEVLILDKDFNLNIWSAFLLYERHFPFTCGFAWTLPDFFIRLSSQTAHSCDFPLVLYQKLHQYLVIL